MAISFRPTWEKLTNQNCITFAKKLRDYWSQGSILLFGPDSVSNHLLIKTMPKIISGMMRCLELCYYLGREYMQTYIHKYTHTYIYAFHRTLRLSPDNRMWNMSKTYKSIQDI